MRVGFIGLGNLGTKLAASLLRNGFSLLIHDIDRAAGAGLVAQGAVRAASGRALAAACEAVITCLPSPETSAQRICSAALGRSGRLKSARSDRRSELA